ncbi:uncharacterized protein LOC110858931 [Folsomia candida]|uniref:Uncharacterized protein n=1 Tax=Folsomia candida TaxID=158441 RepID=A0A226DDH9_FOLCA|nr:uncharacterized protein LOC110858931 [Folsomia candida]OXA43018.1 hypothetical protein Fcan01_21962 [Folsomia candida]
MFLKSFIAIGLVHLLRFHGINAETCVRDGYEEECSGFYETCPDGFTREFYEVPHAVVQCRCVRGLTAQEYQDYLACKCRNAVSSCNPDGGFGARYQCGIAWRDCSDTVKTGLCSGDLTNSKWRGYCCDDVIGNCITTVDKATANGTVPQNSQDIVTLCGTHTAECLSNAQISDLYCPRLATRCLQSVENATIAGKLFTSRDNVTQLCGTEAVKCLPDYRITNIYCPALVSQCTKLIQNSSESIVRNELDVPKLCGAEITTCLSNSEIRNFICAPRLARCEKMIENATFAGVLLNNTSQIERVCGAGIASCLDDATREKLLCRHLLVRCKLTLVGVITVDFLIRANDRDKVCGKNVPETLTCIEKRIFGSTLVQSVPPVLGGAYGRIRRIGYESPLTGLLESPRNSLSGFGNLLG